MAAHRYWRVLVTACNGRTWVGCAEMELFTVVGGADVCSGGTAIQSSNFSGGPAANAFDNNGATNWYSGTGVLPEWLGYDFGAGNDKDIVGFSWVPRNDGFANSDAPNSGSLQYSDDGVAWSTLFSFAGQTAWTIGQRRIFPAGGLSSPGAHRYWRISITASTGGNGQGITECEMRTVAGGADVTGSGTATASNTNFGYTPAGAFDNDGTTGWRMNEGPHWLKYDFGAGNAKEIKEVAITCPYLKDEAIKDFAIEFSDDNSMFTVAMAMSGITNWQPGQRRLFNYAGEVADPGHGPACRHWRLVTLAVQSGSTSTMALSEMEMRLYHGGPDQTGAGTGNNGTPPTAGQNFSNLFDNNTGTNWSTVVTVRQWGWYDFGVGVLKAVNEISLRATTTPGDAPTEFYLQRSDDAVSWSTQFHISGLSGWTAGQTRFFDANGETTGTVDPVYGYSFVST